MNQVTYNLRDLDLHYVFLGIQYLALIVLILILARGLIRKTNLIESKYRTLSWVFTILLVIGVTGVYITDLYNYIHTSRPGYVEITKTIRHQTTGL
jgi:hypothetical protein